ncbi:MAG: aminotransferase class IV [Pirellulales bacterium]|nr:aminotransferase class IV [Pirellulales bacterium]
MPEPKVYLNGKMVPSSQASINIYDLGVVLGATVTEMVRTFHQHLYRLDDHLARIERSLRFVRFDIGMTMVKLGHICEELTKTNAALLDQDNELGLVIFVTAGENRIYAGSAGGSARQTPTVCVHTFRLPFEIFTEKMNEGVHVVTPSTRHVPPQCYDPKMKYRSRMHYYLADQEAHLVDPEAIALLLDLDGNVTETSGANFLMVEDGTIVSPTLRNTLPGISRKTIIELAESLRIPFVERDFQPFNVVNADEAFLATTPYCMMPVTKINGITIGSGRPGEVFKKLMEAWSREVDIDILGQFK